MGTIRVERGGHRTYFVDGGMNRVGTPHNIEIKIELGGRVGSGLVGSVLAGNNTTSWLHLASWNLPDSQLS